MAREGFIASGVRLLSSASLTTLAFATLACGSAMAADAAAPADVEEVVVNRLPGQPATGAGAEEGLGGHLRFHPR